MNRLNVYSVINSSLFTINIYLLSVDYQIIFVIIAIPKATSNNPVIK